MESDSGNPPTLPTPPPPPESSSSPANSSMESAAEKEALRLKALAEDKFRSSNLKSALKYARRARRLRPELDGAGALVTAIKILRAASSDHYKVLRLPPFSQPSSLRRQYRALALALHPDKANASSAAAEEAFKRVADSFRFLSDRRRKQEFDRRLKESAKRAAPSGTFWTACATCRLLHEFDRGYVGFRLVCPSCQKSFLAVEVAPVESGGDRVGVRATRSRSTSTPRIPRFPPLADRKKRKSSSSRVSNSSASPASKKPREKTLAEIQMEITKSREKKKRRKEEDEEKGEEKALVPLKKKDGNLRLTALERKKGKGKEKALVSLKKKDGSLRLMAREREKSQVGKEQRKENEKGRGKAIVAVRSRGDDDLSLMAVEDSDFYDFDRDRTEKSFRKGQVWAVYDDDDGMPRHYGLIEEVLSSSPFRLRMSWLDLQNQGDEALVLWEKSGFHVSCGRFKVGRKVSIYSVNVFSHVVECERAARELYRIYPKKGSVWALYGEHTLGGEQERFYDIVVFLTSYSEMHGLSMAYLEKVEGYKTIFKRRAIGCHAIRWLEKDDVRLFSHQIPARKLSSTEAPELAMECWELDPASLPSDLLAIGWSR